MTDHVDERPGLPEHGGEHDTTSPLIDFVGGDQDHPPAAVQSTPITSGTAAATGLLAAGVALGVGELLSGISNEIPSLIVRIGDVVIDNSPGWLEKWAIDALGTNDKPALVAGITILSLLIGASTGIAAAKNFRTGIVVFTLFGLIGGLAAASDPQRAAVWGWVSAILAATAGILTLRYLLRAARAVWDAAATTHGLANSRRGFLGAAAGAAFVSVIAPVAGIALRRRQSAAVEGDRESVAAVLDSIDPSPVTQDLALESEVTVMPEFASFDDIDGIASLITPNDNFYRIDAALSIPRIDVDTWTMKVTGMVDQEIELSFDDLLAMDTVEEFVTLSCVSNRVGGDLVGNARWLGVPIKTVLDMAGVQPGATQIVGRSVDGWTGGFPTEYLDDPDRVALIAVAMNGEPLPTQHGFPVRLVVAGLYGYVSATKWLSEIELTTWEDFDGYWIPRGWSKLGPIKTQSRIDVPRPNSTISVGSQPIAGVAWDPGPGISRVEALITQIIDGDEVPNDEWIEAELSAEISDNSWRQWMLPWDAPAGDWIIRVRATNGEGETQTPERTDVAPDGASGWHTIAVRVS